jgi:hypothetical protein
MAIAEFQRTRQFQPRVSPDTRINRMAQAQKKGDAGWLRGQTTRRRYHRRSDGGPERRQRCPDGGPEHRYEWYTADPLYVSRPNDNQISGRHSSHTATVLPPRAGGQPKRS